MATAADIRADYESRAAALRGRRDTEARAVTRLGNLRLVVFAAAGLLFARWATTGNARGLWLAAALTAVLGFAILVRASRQAKTRLQHTDDLIALADEGAHRVARAWDRLPAREWTAPPAGHPYAADLDLFGDASLVQLLPPMSAAPGRATLGRWLTEPAPSDEVRRRQQAVLELRSRDALREELAMAGLRVPVTEAGLAALIRWAEGTPWLLERPGLIAASVLFPLATLATLVAQVAGALAQPYWILPAVAGALIAGRYARQVSASFAPVVGRATTLRRYAAMSARIGAESFESSMLAAAHARLTGPPAAHRAMQTLTSLADCTELRLSPMLYAIVNTLTLWDLHVLHLLERWQRRSGTRVAEWTAALGEVESLAALATLAHDNPDWAFPELDEGGSGTIVAEALGHPLLAPEVGVRNDVTVGPAGTVLVVTGSNMAGKSTLLRSIGVNLVLAQAGSTVCARRLRHPPAVLYTSMRVQDSLRRGVSYFMAELERLKLIVDAADALAAARDDRTFVYLLDEILHGTNSAERTIAARHVLRHLIHTGAVGVVSTHDLELADEPALSDAARHVHFQERLQNADGVSTMTFDYTLRPGKATSTNALKLLEMVGLRPPG